MTTEARTKKNGNPAAAATLEPHLPSEGQPGPPWDHGELDPAGAPWWRHELFPLELTPHDQVLRWWKNDRSNAGKGGSGQPEVIMVARWDEASASWVELPGKWSLSTIGRDGLMSKLGPGRYTLTAYAYLPAKEGEARKLAAVRGRGLLIGELEQTDPGDDDDDQEEAADDLGELPRSAALERAHLEFESRRLELGAEESRRRDSWKREELERRERLELAERRYREEREERDRRDRDERDRWREHQKAIADVYARAAAAPATATSNPIADAIMPLLVDKALEFIRGGGGAGEKVSMLAALGSKLAETMSEAIVEIGAPMALAYAKRAGVDMAQLGLANDPAPSSSSSSPEEGGDDGAPE